MTVRKMIRFLSLFLLLNVLIFSSAVTVRADDHQIIIDDEEDLLSADEEKMLKIKMEEVSKYGSVAFVTVSQYGDTSSYAKKLYRSYFGTSSGFLFLIDMGRRNIWIYSDGAIYRVIDKAYANTITDNVYRYASRGEYYNCAYHVFDQASILLEGGRIAQPMKYISNFLIASVVALLINFLFLTLQRESDREIMINSVPAMTGSVAFAVLSKNRTKQRVSRHVEVSSGGGGGYSGGSSGGGGGGGSSGGGGGHSF